MEKVPGKLLPAVITTVPVLVPGVNTYGVSAPAPAPLRFPARSVAKIVIGRLAGWLMSPDSSVAVSVTVYVPVPEKTWPTVRPLPLLGVAGMVCVSGLLGVPSPPF